MKELELPLTVEKQLECYYLSANHTERHEILWHAWNQNKRWINQLLQMTLASFPTYSKHDESHASAVLHNIELILGEERIAQLSASDCFVLLHTVYIHDIGMCITYEDRANIVKNRAFLDMVDELESEGDHSLSEAIEALKKTDYSYHNEEEEIAKTQKLYEDKLKVYYALIHLIANYRRGEHGVRSKEILYKWTLEPDKLGIGFSLSGIPLRIFLSVANSAQLHTNPKFEEILSLPQEDDGFALDYYHPRFISVLLQLGDILDMDNNRFHPLTKECMGSLPELSERHYDKHLAIRRLHIRPDKISIEADCKTQESLRLVRKECDMLISMLKAAGYYWSVICPPDFIGSLPTVEEVNLYLEGQKIPEELVTTQFKISQKKAFSLLEGTNIYSGRFVFLREFLQNAVDSTKMQYWNECCSTKGYYENSKLWKKMSPYELNKKVAVGNFPIEIEMEIQKRDSRGELSPVTKEDVEALDGNFNICEYGVKVRVKDFGLGIDKDRILSISKVGSSRKNDRLVIESMPEWLRPTAEFGIGLQSAFLVTGSFKCYTHTRAGQRYEITFGAAATSRYEGYINVKPVERFPEKEDTFGACFEVFVPANKKLLHQDSYEAWNGEDPFEETYECRRPLRHAAELLSQMALYLNKLIGELLFPVHLRIQSCDFIDGSLNRKEKSRITNIDVQFSNEENTDIIKRLPLTQEIEDTEIKIYDKYSLKSREVFEDIREWGNGKPSWIFYYDVCNKTKRFKCGTFENLIYMLDYNSGKLHIWDGSLNVFIAISARKLIELEKQMTASGRSHLAVSNGTDVYYKGIELQRRCIEEDSELIEYVDIKGRLERKYINLSRNGFTEEGERYFKSEIYRPCLTSAQKVLKDIGNDANQLLSVIEKRCKVLSELYREIEETKPSDLRGKEDIERTFHFRCLSQKKEEYEKQLIEQIISSVMLGYLAIRAPYGQIGCPSHGGSRECPWEKLINGISMVLDKYKTVQSSLSVRSSFFHLLSFDETCNYQFGLQTEKDRKRQRISFAEVFAPMYSYMIVQKREDDLQPWKQYLIQLSPQQSIVNRILELQFVRDEKAKEKEEQSIALWGEQLLKNARNFGEMFYVHDDSKQQFIIKWLLKSVPTVGIFANKTGNIRVNVLSMKTTRFLFVNENYKLLVAQRMLDIWRRDGIQRFSVHTWHSNQYLACSALPYHMFLVKRGFFGDFSLSRTVVPLNNEEFSEIYTILQDDTNAELARTVQSVYEKIDMDGYLKRVYEEYSKKSNRLSPEEIQIAGLIQKAGKEKIFVGVSGVYTELVFNTIFEKCGFWTVEKWQDIGKTKYDIFLADADGIWQGLMQDIVRIHCDYFLGNIPEREYKKGMKEIARADEFWELCRAWLYVSYHFLNITNQELKMPAAKEKFLYHLQNGKATGKLRRICKYVEENGCYQLAADSVENCYYQFSVELYKLFEKLEMRNKRTMIKMVGSEKHRVFLQKIGRLFEQKQEELILEDNMPTE